MLTQSELDERRECVGSSDVPLFFNGQALVVWLRKVHGERAETLPLNDPMALGSVLETPTMDFAESLLGPIERKVRQRHPVLPLASSLDGKLIEVGEPVEAKTAGIAYHREALEWGDEGTDEIPQNYILQCHAHLMVTDRDVCHVPALLGGRGFAMFRVTRNEELCNIIEDRVCDFWHNYVVPEIEPTADAMLFGDDVLRTLKRLRRTPEKIVTYPRDRIKLIDQWEAAKATIRTLEKVKDAIEAQVMLPLGDAEAATLPDGRMLTYMERTRKGYEVKPSTYRVLQVKEEHQAAKLLEAV